MPPRPASIACQHCGSVERENLFICRVCAQHFGSPAGVLAASWGRRLGAFLLDALLMAVTALIGWLIWAMFTFGRGQTPGKLIVGIRIVRDSGQPSTWGWTFVREIVVKRILVGAISAVSLGLFSIANYLWPLWDPNKQALHDKMMGTVVVKTGPARVRSFEENDRWLRTADQERLPSGSHPAPA
jgi:uncharacterized RDD family membrane protein YckC